jgi:hypothetical protein
MGSLNTDGSPITQTRQSVRKIGASQIVSSDRVESEVIREPSPETASDDVGTNANQTTSQYSTTTSSNIQKITNSHGDTLVERI